MFFMWDEVLGDRGVTIQCRIYFHVTAGRPEKMPDVCYSWWVLAALKMIGRIHWISKVPPVPCSNSISWVT